MKRFLIISAAAACLLAACAKTRTTSSSDATKRHFDAWVHVQKQKHPEYLWEQTELGSWLLEDETGTGDMVGEFEDSLYLLVNYTYYDLEGNVTNTTSKLVSQQVGEYDETAYYGPGVWYAKGVYAGFEEILKGMRDGGRRKFAVPAWLETFNRFDSAEQYLAQSSDSYGSSAVCDVELVEHFPYIVRWGVDSVGRYLARNYSQRYGGSADRAKADSAGTYGFYYIQEKAPADTVTLKDTTVYINYIGRLLNGRVFDTTIRDTAIFYGLSRTATYAPVSITYDSEGKEVTMGGDNNSVVSGFSLTLSRMKAYEKGTGIFISGLGYGYRGSGTKIPPYAPLRFDVEIVDNPN